MLPPLGCPLVQQSLEIFYNEYPCAYTYVSIEGDADEDLERAAIMGLSRWNGDYNLWTYAWTKGLNLMRLEQKILNYQIPLDLLKGEMSRTLDLQSRITGIPRLERGLELAELPLCFLLLFTDPYSEKETVVLFYHPDLTCHVAMVPLRKALRTALSEYN